jgi:hypothetical protein
MCIRIESLRTKKSTRLTEVYPENTDSEIQQAKDNPAGVLRHKEKGELNSP